MSELMRNDIDVLPVTTDYCWCAEGVNGVLHA
jgi:hypothetical protein